MATVIDETGNLHTGTLVGTPAFSPGVVGLGIVMDGANDYITIEDAADLNGSAFTYMAWVKTSNATTLQAVVVNWQSATNRYGSWMKITSSGLLTSMLGDGTTASHIIEGSLIADGEWHHAAVTFDGNKLITYLDGVEDGSLVVGSPVAYVPTCAAVIGALSNDDGSTYSQWFDGMLDDARIYNEALSASEIHEIVHANPNSFDDSIYRAGPYWNWKLDESTGIIASEQNSNGDLEYESDASTAGYSIAASQADGAGASKDVNANTALQIYDPAVETPGVGNDPAPTDWHQKYTFDNDSATVLYDEHASSRDFAVTGTAVHTTGLSGSAIGKTSSGTIYNGTQDIGFNLTDDYSISFFIKGTNPVAGGSSGVVLALGMDGTNSGLLIQVITATGQVSIAVGDNSAFNYQNTANNNVTDGEWHHIVITAEFDSVDTNVIVYHDGVAGTTGTFTGQTHFDTTSTMGLFARHGGTYHLLNMELDSLELYSRTLTAAEVDNIAAELVASPAAPEDYVAYWSMDDAQVSGNTLLDQSGNSHTATMVNTPTTGETGQVNEAVLFNGTNEYATVVDHANFNAVNLSISVWLKKGSSSGVVFSNFDAVSNNYTGYYLAVGSGIAPALYICKGTGNVNNVDFETVSAGSLSDGAWHHIVCTFDGTELVGYCDGVLTARVAWANPIVYNGSEDIHIGCREWVTTRDNYFDSHMDELKVFNRAITAQEVEELYLDDGGWLRDTQDYVARWEMENVSTVAMPTDFVAEWKLDTDGSETNAAHPATLAGSPTFGNGFVDDSMILDGATQYATIVDHADLRPAALTVCAWVNSSVAQGYAARIFCTYRAVSSYRFGYQLVVDSKCNITLYNGTTTTEPVASASSSTVVDDGKWHHICGTYDGTNLSIYVDGSLESSVAGAGALAYSSPHTDNIRIGCAHGWATDQFFFKGRIDGVKLFDYAATADQIMALSRMSPDASYNQLKGLVYGDPISTLASGQIGNAMTFDGTDDYVELLDSSLLKPSIFTATAWVKTSSITHGGILQSYMKETHEAGFHFRVTEDGNVRLVVAQNIAGGYLTNYHVLNSAVVVNDDTWHHAAASYDGVDMKVYVDGVLDGTQAFAGTVSYVASSVARIGGENLGGASLVNQFEGEMDDVRLYDRAISQAEVLNIYNSTLPAPPTDFVVEWLMDNGSSVTVPAPVARWTFDSITGTEVHEENYTPDNDITLFNTVNVIPAFEGNGISASGTTSYGYTNSLTGMVTTPTQVTFSLWANTTTVTSPSETYYNLVLMDFGFDGSFDGIYLHIRPDGDANAGQCLVSIGNGASRASLLWSKDIRDGGWHHLAIVARNSGNHEFYVDGELVHQRVSTGLVTDGTDINLLKRTGKKSVLGVILDDVKVWDIALTAEEILGDSRQTPDTTNTHPAILVASPTFTKGWENNALSLNGTTQYATVVDHDDLKPTEISVCAWVRYSSTSESYIFQSYNNESSAPRAGFILGTGGGIVSLTIGANTGLVYGTDYDYVTAITTTNDGQWHHIAVTYDGSDIHIYVNGELENTTAYIGGIGYTASNRVRIGDNNSAGSEGFFFDGSIDKLQVFDRAVTAEEVAAMSKFRPVADAIPPVPAAYTIGDLTAQDFTIECAFKINTATLDMHLMSKSVDTVNWTIRLDSASGNILKLDLIQSDDIDRTQTLSADLAADGVAADDVWHWLSVRMDYTGSGLLTCQIDGAETLSVDASSWSGIWKNTDSSRFTIGDSDKDGSNPWDGGVDEVAIYQKALSDEFRLSNYNWWKYNAQEEVIIEFTIALSHADITDAVPSGAYTTPLLTVTIDDGVGPFNILWSSDGANLSPDNPSSLSTTFSGNEDDVATTETLTCQVTDLGDGSLIKSDTITTDITWAALLATVTLDESNIVDTVPSGAYTTPLISSTVVDGVGPFTYLWSSGGAKLTPDNPTSPNTTFSGTETGTTTTEILTCEVTDTGNGNVTCEAYVNTNIVWNASTFAVDVTPDTLADVNLPDGLHTTPLLTAAPTGGFGPYSYLWESSDPLLTPDTPTASTTTFSGNQSNALASNAELKCTVTDTGDPFNGQVSDSTFATVEWSNVYAPVAHWTYDDITGYDVADETGNGHIATLSRIPIIELGHDGNSLYYNTTDPLNQQYGVIPNHAAFRAANFTFATWSKISGLDAYANKVLFQSWGNDGGAGGFNLSFQASRYHANIASDTGFSPGIDFTKLLGVTWYTPDVWQHVAVTYDGATLKLYLDGVLDTSIPWAAGVGYNAGNSVVLGAIKNGPSAIYAFKGNMDESRFYNIALSASEINTLYNLPNAMGIAIGPPQIDLVVNPAVYTVSEVIQAYISGGVGPFNYSWSRTVGTTMSISGSSSVAAITVEGQAASSETTDTFKCIVTDTGDSNRTIEATIDVNINWDAV